MIKKMKTIKSADPGRQQGGARQGREVVDNNKYNNGSWEAFQSSSSSSSSRAAAVVAAAEQRQQPVASSQ